MSWVKTIPCKFLPTFYLQSMFPRLLSYSLNTKKIDSKINLVNLKIAFNQYESTKVWIDIFLKQFHAQFGVILN